MTEFIFQIIFFTSLAGVLVVVSRSIPRIREEEIKGDFSFEKWIESLPLDRIDYVLKNFSHKVLRKLRLILLKVDNAVGKYLEKTKESNGGNGIKVEDLIEKTKEEEKK